jgi:hypothetical protein
MRRRVGMVAVVAALEMAVLACDGGDDDAAANAGSSRSTPSPPSSSPPSTTASSAPTVTSTAPPPVASRPVTIAFAGDVHFEGFLATRLADPVTAMGPLARTLDRADLAIVNLETAVTTRGSPQPKQYTFRSPPVVFKALRLAGIDVVTMANNHGLDYGPVSVPDAIAAARAANVPIIGFGQDVRQAYRAWIITVRGQRIAFLAATAVLDPNLVSSWTAGPAKPGLATALDGNNAALVHAVKAVRPHVDTVVVDLHYGKDLTSCPTEIQRKLASDLVGAGADIVVGQHAHILLGAGYQGSAYVDFGLGNFQFYVSAGNPTAETGVLVLTVDGRDIGPARWVPGQILNGLPTPLSGDAGTQAVQRWQALRPCTGLTANSD